MPEVKLSDGSLHYEVFGSGPPLLFLSQTAWYGGIWKLEQVPDLSRDHMVVVYDQRGTGKSRVETKDFSTARLAADAIAVLDAVGVAKANVCGHSNGGRVAQVMALDYPDRVDKLLLASAGGSGSKSSQGGLPLGMVLEIIEKGYPGYARTHSLENGFTKAFIDAHPERANALMDDYMANLAPPEIFLRHVLGRQGTDTTARLKDIKARTLVMVGDDEDHGASSDLTHLAFAKILADRIPDVQFVVFPGEGHNYWFSAPKAFNNAVRNFIAGR